MWYHAIVFAIHLSLVLLLLLLMLLVLLLVLLLLLLLPGLVLVLLAGFGRSLRRLSLALRLMLGRGVRKFV